LYCGSVSGRSDGAHRVLISFFPIVVNVATGLATIEPGLEDVLRALGASKLDIMRKVGIPRPCRFFVGSLKVAITPAFVGSVIAESVASNTGVGNLMLQAQTQFQVPPILRACWPSRSRASSCIG